LLIQICGGVSANTLPVPMMNIINGGSDAQLLFKNLWLYQWKRLLHKWVVRFFIAWKRYGSLKYCCRWWRWFCSNFSWRYWRCWIPLNYQWKMPDILLVMKLWSP
jgi:hypothetical protein